MDSTAGARAETGLDTDLAVGFLLGTQPTDRALAGWGLPSPCTPLVELRARLASQGGGQESGRAESQAGIPG